MIFYANKLFDGGFIAFDDSGKIIVSDRLTKSNRVFMNIRNDMHIPVSEDNAEYIRYHRTYVFK